MIRMDETGTMAHLHIRYHRYGPYHLTSRLMSPVCKDGMRHEH